MKKIEIELAIAQSVDVDEVTTVDSEDLADAFFNPDPYFMHDSLPEEFGISVHSSEVKVTGTEQSAEKLERTIGAHIRIAVDDWDGLYEFLEQDGVLDNEEFDADAFARHYLGDWEGVLIEDEDIDVNCDDVTGSLSASD